jgi:hypothetical protein
MHVIVIILKYILLLYGLINVDDIFVFSETCLSWSFLFIKLKILSGQGYQNASCGSMLCYVDILNIFKYHFVLSSH